MNVLASSSRWLLVPAILSIVPGAFAQLGPSAAPMRLVTAQCTYNDVSVPCGSAGTGAVSNGLSLTGYGTSTVLLTAASSASATCYEANSGSSAAGTVEITVPAYTLGSVRPGTAQFSIQGHDMWALASAGVGDAAGWIEGAGWCDTGGGNRYCESVGSTPFILGKRFLIRMHLDASEGCQNPFRTAGAEQTSAVAQISITDAGGAAVPIYYQFPSPGFVYGWGSNVNGELGDPTLPVRVGTPVLVKGPSSAVSVGAGTYNSAVLLSDGTVWQWGALASNSPTQVALPTIGAIAKGYNHTLAVTPDGKVWAWGLNNYGQIGNGTATDTPSPVRLAVFDSLGPVIAIAANEGQSLAVTADGRLWAWGYWTVFHQVTTPELVTGVPAIVAVAAGRAHSLALAADSTVWAWGFGTSGELGNGTSLSSYSPVQVSNLSGVVQISAGERRSLAMKNDGTAWAWGVGVGDGSFGQRAAPKAVPGLNGLNQVSDFAAHSQVLYPSGDVWGWGWDYYGQLADGNWNTNFDTPQKALNLNAASAVSAGFGHSLAIVPSQAYTVNVTVNPPGTGTVTGGGAYPAGTQISLTATPAQYYSFVSFSGDVASTLNPLPLTVNASQNIVANFALTTFYTLIAAPSPAAGGTVTGSGNYAPGSTVTVTATPAAGYQFVSFSGDLTGSTNPQPIVMNGPKFVSANFAAVVPMLSASVINKSGGAATRIWTIQLANNGLAAASDAQITGISFKQVAGATCPMPQVTAGNVVTTVAGNGSNGFNSYWGENVPAVSAGVDAFNGDVKVDGAGNIYIADYYANRVRKVTAGYIRTLAGTGAYPVDSHPIGDGGRPESALMCAPMGLSFGPYGDLYVADYCNTKVRKINAAQTLISSLPSGANYPVGVAVDSSDSAYVYSGSSQAIRKASTCGTTLCWSTLIGSVSDFGTNVAFPLRFDRTGSLEFLQDPNVVSKYPLPSGPISDSTIPRCTNCLSSPPGLSFDAANNLYVSVQPNAATLAGQIWKRDSGGAFSVFAGSGNCSFDTAGRNPGTGDNGPGKEANFCLPEGLDFDTAGNLYVGELGRVRMVSPTRLLPAGLGPIAAPVGGVPGTASGLFTVEFGSCTAASRFSVTVNFQANGGAYTGSTTLSNQYR